MSDSEMQEYIESALRQNNGFAHVSVKDGYAIFMTADFLARAIIKAGLPDGDGVFRVFIQKQVLQ